MRASVRSQDSTTPPAGPSAERGRRALAPPGGPSRATVLALALAAGACTATEPGERARATPPAASGAVSGTGTAPPPATSAATLATEPAPAPARSAPDGPGEDVTLPEALTWALAGRPELRAADRERAARLVERRLASRPREPYVQIDAEDFLGTGDLSWFDQSQLTVWYGQLIERGGSREARENEAEVELDLVDLDRVVLAHDVAARTTSAFLRALLAQQELELARAAEEAAETLHAAVRERVEAGKVSPVEESKHALVLASARLDRARAERELEATRLELARSWSSPHPCGTAVGAFGGAAQPAPIEVLRERLAEGPRMRRLEAEVRASAARLERARADAVNPWLLQAGIRRFEQQGDVAGVLTVLLPLRVHGRGSDSVEAARERMRRTEHDQDAARAELEAALDRTWNLATRSHDEVAALEGGVLERASQVLEAVDEGYREGKFELTDLIDAQRTYFDVRARWLRSLADHHLAVTELERLIGGPLP